MAQEEKQMEKMKQEIKKIFEKEGEMGYITLNLVETKEKLMMIFFIIINFKGSENLLK